LPGVELEVRDPGSGKLVAAGDEMGGELRVCQP